MVSKGSGNSENLYFLSNTSKQFKSELQGMSGSREAVCGTDKCYDRHIKLLFLKVLNTTRH